LSKIPDELTAEHVRTLFHSGLSRQDVEDAMAVVTLFSITVRLANALDFDIPGDGDFFRAAPRMLKQGYVFGKSKMQGQPNHQALAEVLQKRVLEGQGLT